MSDWPTSSRYQTHVAASGESPFAIPAGADFYLKASASAGASFVANLPPATGSGFVKTVKKTDANAHPVAVTPNGADLIDRVNAAQNIQSQDEALSFIDAEPGKWDIL